MGAMMYGRISQERLLFNHEDLYYPRDVPEQLDVSDQLPEVRRLIREGKNQEADNHLFEVYKERLGGEASMHTRAGRDPYHPFCGLTLNTTPSAPFRGYRRGVEFDTGRAWVK
ncbi:MAG: glycoside hydrolase family 95 protein [Kiritimatiellae bacterium]|nr:glycoside hydrolase family 95 protein [Kiritimatiellia bacterium]